MGREKPPRFTATIGLGSNIGDKAANIARAIHILGNADKSVLRLVAKSRLYTSPPWGETDQEPFVNAAVSVSTTASPHELLHTCLAVENGMGRVRDKRWGPRIIDADILTFEDWLIDEPDLKVPHPLIAQRAFVLLPLRDVAPQTQINGRSLDDLIAELGDSGTRPL